jgi:hypothetical protein
MALDLVVSRLKDRGLNPHETAAGHWRSRCPCHKGKSANLSVDEKTDGTVVVHCHHEEAGGKTCSADAIVKALGLGLKDLFPPRPDAKPKGRKSPGAAKDRTDKAGSIYRTPERAIAGCLRGIPGGRLSGLGPWIYKDAEGFEVMRIYRVDQPGGDKQFRPVYPDAAGWRVGDPYKSRLPLYHLDEIQSADVVYVCEGEKCADLVRNLGVIATTSSHGSDGAKKTDWSALAGKDVRIIPDHDRAGEGYLEAVGAILAGLDPKPVVKVVRLPVAGDGDDAEQWLELLPDSWGPDECRAELERLASAAAAWEPDEARLVVRADTVAAEDVEWLWKDRIPCSFITIFAGRTGIGKTFVALDIAARKTKGDPMPDSNGECCKAGNVLIISEDSQSKVLRPRLEAMGADLSRVYFMTWEAMAEYQLGDVEMLDRVVREAGDPDLIIIDPPTNFLGDVDEHRNSEVRAVLMKIVAWLMRQSRPIALILITQVTKGGREVEAINRIIGSIAWSATSRIAHTFGPDGDVKGGGFFSCPKNNLGPTPDTIRYRIVPTDKAARIEWGDKSDKSADEVMSGGKKEQNRCITAEAFLIERFNQSRSWWSEELFSEGAKLGISRIALFEAKRSLGLPKARKIGDIWMWSVSDDWPHLRPKKKESQHA